LDSAVVDQGLARSLDEVCRWKPPRQKQRSRELLLEVRELAIFGAISLYEVFWALSWLGAVKKLLSIEKKGQMNKGPNGLFVHVKNERLKFVS